MENPILYINANAGPRRDAMELVPRYMEQVQWRGTADETVLDVGCGSGDITWDILKPHLPSTARIFGADISPAMIAYASKLYPDVEFFVLDIGSKHLPNCWIAGFDHIFSSYCFHWIQDQRQVMQNIYNLLKPKGDLFTYYLGTHPFFDAVFHSSQLMKWKHYISDEDAHKYTNIYQHEDSEDVEKQLHEFLIDVGFNVSSCKVINRQLVFSNLEKLRVYLKAIHPHYAKIPTDLREDFIDDTMQELFKLKSYQEKNINDNFNDIVISYTLVVIVATKDNIN